jgi:hypothetical protein
VRSPILHVRTTIVFVVAAPPDAGLIASLALLAIDTFAHLLRHRLSFPHGGEITVCQDLLLAMLSVHPGEALT